MRTVTTFSSRTQVNPVPPVLIALMIAVAALWSPASAVAQTGPGGVGNSSDNVLWLKADEGISDADGAPLTGWTDQSGNGNSPADFADAPTYATGTLNGLPVVAFDGGDNLPMPAALDGLSDDDNTIIVVSRRTGSVAGQDQFLWNQGQRVLGYNIKAGPARFNFLSASGDRTKGGPNGTTRATSSASGATAFNVISTMVDDAAGDVDLVVNGSVNTGDSEQVGSNAATIGTGLIGEVAEVIVYNRTLNSAELRAVYTYLSEKYDITIDTDLFSDSRYRFELAGIGSNSNTIGAAASGDHLEAQSANLRFSASSLVSDTYAFVGHDGKVTSFSNQEQPNGETNVQKTLREWRVDLTNASTASLTLSGDLAGSLGSFDDFAVFVDRDGDFSNGAEFYDLNLNSGTGLYESDPITINDGDYIALARIQRTVSFAEADDSGFEGDAGVTNPAIPLELNYPNRTDLSVDIQVFSGTNAPVEGTDYETCCAATTALTIPAGVTSFNINDTGTAPNSPEPLGVIGDATQENNTEFVNIDLVNLASTDFVRSGANPSFEYGIVDDDGSLPTATVSFGTPSVPENSGTAVSATIALSSAAAGGEEVFFELSGDATPGDDYTPTTPDGSVSFVGGETQQTVDITPIDDALFEGTESVVLTLVAAENGATLDDTGGTLPSASFDITDDETAPTIAFSSNAYTGAEGENATLVVEISASAGTDITVEFTEPTDTGNDFTTITSSPVTIPAGETTRPILVAVDDDATVEFNETFTFNLQNPTGATLGTPSSTDLRLIDNDRIGPNGPGGVGDRDNLAAWLDASVLDLADGAAVDTWTDRSENGNDAVADGSAPTFTASSGTLNSLPVVSFASGNNEFLLAPGLADIALNDNTIFTALTTSSTGQSIFSLYDQPSDTQTRALVTVSQGGGRFESTQDGATAQRGLSTGTLQILESQFTGTTVDLSVNAGALDSDTGGASVAGTDPTIGAETYDANNGQPIDIQQQNYFDGEIGDFIAYRAALNEAQRTIVSNYLTAKYALGNTDEYTGDTAEGYGSDVIGVGYIDDDGDSTVEPEEVHSGASLGGLRFDDIGGLDTDGDFLFAGHNTPTTDNFVTTSDLAANGGLTLASRVQRAWYTDRSSDGGSAITVDVTIDLSETGLGSDPAQDIGLPSNYVLISCADDPNDGDCASNWTEVSSASGVEGDAITFADVTLNDGTFYTIGSSDRTVSPLLTLSLVIEGVVGNEGDAVAGTEGGDAGWRMIGPPIQTAAGDPITAGDLKSDTDPVFIEFNTPSPLFYTWDETTQVFNVGSATTEIPPGRGSIVYILDDLGIDDADPIDPSIVIQPITGEPTGETEIAADNLPTGAAGDVHFVANPYPYNYDLSALTAGGNAFTNSFQADVQAWDPYSSGTDTNGNTGTYQMLSTVSGSSDIVGTWQAFFVERNGTGTDTEVTFDLAGRSFGDTDPILGGAKSIMQPPKRIELELLATDKQGNVQAVDRAAWIRFTDAATPAFDVYDATKYTPLAARYVTLAPVGTLRDGTQGPKAVESLPVPSDPVTVDLQVTSRNVAGAFNIALAGTRNIPDAWSIELIDTKGTPDSSDDTVTDLRGPAKSMTNDTGEESITLAMQTPHALPETGVSVTAKELRFASKTGRQAPEMTPFHETLRSELGTARPTAKSVPDSTTVPPYRLRITPKNAPLPVELGTFSGRQAEDAIVLEWTTLSETRNDGFEVQVKPEGASSFRAAGYVSGRGTTTEASSYTFTVEDDLDYGEHTFRLRQVDTDGTASYSKSIPVKKTLDRAYDLSKTAPNPVKTTAGMDLTVREKQTVRVTLYDVLGRRVATVYDSEVLPNQTKDLSVDASRLASGVYFIRVVGENFSDVRRMTVVR